MLFMLYSHNLCLSIYLSIQNPFEFQYHYLCITLKYLNHNGKIFTTDKQVIPTDNGAFRYGYGIFETMLVTNGHINLYDYHWERLYSGLHQLYFDIPALFTPTWLEQQILKTVEKNNELSLCRVRLQLYANGGGLFTNQKNNPGILIECFELDEHITAFNENGLLVGIAENLTKNPDSLSNLKSCNALIYAIAAKQAKEQKWNDTLICNTRDNIIESAIANIFWVKNGELFTPPLSEGCVAGIMRRHIMEKSDRVIEKKLSLAELHQADEIFLTNAIKGIKWVATIQDTQYTHRFTSQIHSLIFNTKKTVVGV